MIELRILCLPVKIGGGFARRAIGGLTGARRARAGFARRIFANPAGLASSGSGGFRPASVAPDVAMWILASRPVDRASRLKQSENVLRERSH